jgi:hypothetical protein
MREARDSPKAWLDKAFIVPEPPANFTVALTEDHVPSYMRSQRSGKYVPVGKRVVDASGVMMSQEEHERLRHQRAPAEGARPTGTQTGAPVVRFDIGLSHLKGSTH